jgi:hypothetical protein
MLPTIWGTYMKLVTKYQISAINSCWEKCDEKCAFKSMNETVVHCIKCNFSFCVFLLYPRSPKGEGVYCFTSVHLSVQDIFHRIFLSQLSRQTGSRNLTGQKTLPTIWGTYMKLVTKYQISAINSCWEKLQLSTLKILQDTSTTAYLVMEIVKKNSWFCIARIHFKSSHARQFWTYIMPDLKYLYRHIVL